MRIAFVTDGFWPKISGVAASIQAFREELEKLGHTTIVLSPHYPGKTSTKIYSHGIYYLPSDLSLVSKEDRRMKLQSLPRFMRIMQNFRPDIIHINTEFMAGFFAWLFAKLRGYPILATSHTDYEDYVVNYIKFLDPRIAKAIVRFIFRRAYKSSNYIIVPSRFQKQKLISYNIYKPYFIIPSGVANYFAPQNKKDVAEFKAALELQYPQLRDKKYLLFTGRITIEKNLVFLIPVLKKVFSLHKNIAFVIAGDGYYRHSFELKLKTNRLDTRCAFIGQISHNQLPIVYASSYIFLLPSITETQGMCTVEAMATGLPVVAVGAMGTIDVMGGDNGGFMVKENSDDFANAILRLLEDPQLHAQKSEEALQRAKSYRIDHTTTKLVHLYKEIAAHRNKNIKNRNARLLEHI